MSQESVPSRGEWDFGSKDYAMMAFIFAVLIWAISSMVDTNLHGVDSLNVSSKVHTGTVS